MSVTDTSENPKEFLGREKPCISRIPMKLMLRLAAVHKLGAQKYGQKNWRIQPVRMSTYYDAMFRHMVEWFEEGRDADPESNEHPLLHVVACALIILDAAEHGSIKDDRAFAEVLTGKLAEGSEEPDPPPEVDPIFIAQLEAEARERAAEVRRSLAQTHALPQPIAPYVPTSARRTLDDFKKLIGEEPASAVNSTED